MERAGRFLSKLKLGGAVGPDDLALAAWPAAVGKRLAQRTRAVSLVRGNLIVEVEDGVWQKQLFYLRGQILNKIHLVMGDATVTDVEFRIGPPRRPPQTSARLRTDVATLDDADGIVDPVLRVLYKQARKKAIG
ncbi:MAG TPA: DUF721 domain-containing protein [Bryobacteraceae bacterium]|nr:DUF721 domain-containing protein [Bryobacteraceae bacterium]